MLNNTPVKRRIALVVLTSSGLAMALRLQHQLAADVHIYASQRALKTQNRAAEGAGENTLACSVTGFENAGPLLARLWAEYDQIVLFLALGVAVRLIAPLLQDKYVDPGIVAIDDAGRFAISVVSGHMGDANSLAKQCAHLLGATPVVTTASDVHHLPAIDLLGRGKGWRREDASDITSVSASMINGERVAVLQETGELDWWESERSWPRNLIRITDQKEVSASSFAALIVISDRLIEALPEEVPAVIYRPPSLVLGIGCRRGVSFERLDTFIKETLAAHRLAFQSVAVLATAEIKADETAIQTLVERSGWRFEAHPVGALKAVVETPNPSERVRQLVGTPSVCEAAALLSSKGGELVIVKHKGEGMTMAVARRGFSALNGDIVGSADPRVVRTRNKSSGVGVTEGGEP